MICPILTLLLTNVYHNELNKFGTKCFNECAWWDEKKGQCCIKTLAQKDNSKVSIAR